MPNGKTHLDAAFTLYGYTQRIHSTYVALVVLLKRVVRAGVVSVVRHVERRLASQRLLVNQRTSLDEPERGFGLPSGGSDMERRPAAAVCGDARVPSGEEQVHRHKLAVRCRPHACVPACTVVLVWVEPRVQEELDDLRLAPVRGSHQHGQAGFGRNGEVSAFGNQRLQGLEMAVLPGPKRSSEAVLVDGVDLGAARLVSVREKLCDVGLAGARLCKKWCE